MLDCNILIPDKEPERQYYFIDLLKNELVNNDGLNSFCVITFGCQMNARDSEKIIGILKNIGLKEENEDAADIVVYNTCTVRENANQKIYGHLGKQKSLVRTNKNKLVAICGCMMQEQDEVRMIEETYPFVRLIFGTHNLYRFAELLYRSLHSKKTLTAILEDSSDIVENLPVDRKYFFKSGINISFGCDNFCTYCIVPYVRGREKSRKPEDIIDEIKKLVENGVIEIMLLGQNVNSYGKGLKEKCSFPELLRRVDAIEGLKRIRFMTSNPHDLSEELIDVMANSSKICKHFHLPLQSGSNRILKLMNRRYTRERYIYLAKLLREKVEGISITTDIIVGFPGETEEDFLDTLDVVEQIEYDNAFTFIYSKRTGTKAATMEDQVPEDVIKDRFNRLLDVVHEKASKRANMLTGGLYDVLVESVNEKDNKYLTGRLSNNSIVHFEGDADSIGNIVKVKLTECKGFYYIGELYGKVNSHDGAVS